MLYGYEGDSGLWLAGGKQKQWGFKQSAGQTTSIDFPIPFTTNDYTIVVCQGMNVTNEWGANYYVLVGTKQLNSINAFTTAPYSNGGNVVFWIALNSQKQWGYYSGSGSRSYTVNLPISYSNAHLICVAVGYKTTYESSGFSVGALSKNSFNYYTGTGMEGCRFISIGK